jgi:hypothetical protein
MSTNEEMIAHAIADELRPWLDRIKQLEVKTIEQAAELRVLKELALSSRDEKHFLFPGERAHRLGTN